MSEFNQHNPLDYYRHLQRCGIPHKEAVEMVNKVVVKSGDKARMKTPDEMIEMTIKEMLSLGIEEEDITDMIEQFKNLVKLQGSENVQ